MHLKVGCSNFSPDQDTAYRAVSCCYRALDTAVLFIQNFMPTLFLQTPFEGQVAKGLQIRQLFPKMKGKYQAEVHHLSHA